MDLLRRTAEDYVEFLRTTREATHLLELSVTNKGGAPAQTAKQIILGRLTHASGNGLLERVKGDMYSLQLDGRPTLFRFAVTMSKGAAPWFNLTEAEIQSLEQRRCTILVVWNRDEPEHWCKELVIFAIPPNELLRSYQLHSKQILRSMLSAAYTKLDKEGKTLGGLAEAVRERIDPSVLKRPDVTEEDLLSARGIFVECIAEYINNGGDGGGTFSVGGKSAASRVRDRLFSLLVQIEQQENGEYVARHRRTVSNLLELDASLYTTIMLGEVETRALRSAYLASETGMRTEVAASDGIEEEDPPDGIESIRSPYDPTKSKIDTRVVTIDLLAKRIRAEEIDLEPDFQRKAGLWSHKQMSQLIESLLIRVPLPAFYFDATEDSCWLVVDGLQRLTTFREFLVRDMRLDGLEYLTQYNGKRFIELPRALQRIIEESQVTVHLIQPGTPPEVKFNIFRRINTGGIALTLQEIRHALNQGPVTTFLMELASCPEFLEATTHSISNERMADRELVLRFLAFTVTGYLDYRAPDMDAFLSVKMAQLNKLDARFPELRERFSRSMAAAKSIFGNQAFRKMYFVHQSRSPINKALFESWSTALGALSDDDLQLVVQRKDQVLGGAIHLCNEDEFHRAISQGTQDVAKVRKRFEAVNGLLARILSGATNDKVG